MHIDYTIFLAILSSLQPLIMVPKRYMFSIESECVTTDFNECVGKGLSLVSLLTS